MVGYDKRTMLAAARIVRLYAASRPLMDQTSVLIRGRFEGEQASCSYLANLFEQMAREDCSDKNSG